MSKIAAAMIKYFIVNMGIPYHFTSLWQYYGFYVILWTTKMYGLWVVIPRIYFLEIEELKLVILVSNIVFLFFSFLLYSKTCVKRSLKNRQNKGPNDYW